MTDKHTENQDYRESHCIVSYRARKNATIHKWNDESESREIKITLKISLDELNAEQKNNAINRWPYLYNKSD